MLLAAVLAATALAATTGPWPDPGDVRMVGGGEADAAILVAISDYAELPDIPGATENADLWMRWLVAGRGLAPERVHRLYDRDAVKEDIGREVAAAAAEVEAGGTLWVLFVGHGAPAADGGDVVLVGYDARATARSLYARSVARSEILAAAGDAHPAVVVLDSCFSGEGYGGARLVDDNLAPVIPIEALRGAPQATVLSATAEGEFAGPLPGAVRPAFSFLLLGALGGWGDRNRDDVVTTAEAVAWTRGALSVTVEGRKQTPQVGAHDPVMSFAGGAATAAAPDVLAIADKLKGNGGALEAGVAVGDVDLAARQRELQESQRLREEAERREAVQREAMVQAERVTVSRLTLALQEGARRDWEGAAGLGDPGRAASSRRCSWRSTPRRTFA